MAGLAAGRRAMMFEICRGIAMAAQAEVVKARLGTDMNRRPTATVAADAGIAAGTIAEVVMADDAVDCAVFVVRKVDRQRDRAPEHRLPQCQRCVRDHQRQQSEHRKTDAGNYTPE